MQIIHGVTPFALACHYQMRRAPEQRTTMGWLGPLFPFPSIGAPPADQSAPITPQRPTAARTNAGSIAGDGQATGESASGVEVIDLKQCPHLLAEDATDRVSNHRARRRPSAVHPSLSAGLNNYFLIVCHHDDLAAKDPPAYAQDRLSCQLRPADRLALVLLISLRSPSHEI